jgi:hypothetical protein
MSRHSTLRAKDVVERYFLENRARLLEIAAFLDRVDRAEGAEAAREDHRYRALIHGLRLVLEGEAKTRTATLHESLSDPSSDPLESAAGLERASGAWPGRKR